MLVLERRLMQTILIDPRQCPVDELGMIRVMVVDIRRGGKVRLGVEAPSKVVIVREELMEENRG